MDAPTSAAAGAAVQSEADAKKSLRAEPPARDPRTPASAVTVRRTLERGAGVDCAAGTVRHERQCGRAALLAKQSDEAADMRRGKGAAVDDKPSSSRFGCWDALSGRYVDRRAQASHGCVRDGDDPRQVSRKPAVRPAQIVSGDDGYPAIETDLQELAEQPVVGAGEAHVDDVGILVDREIQGFDEAEAVAHGVAARFLPAGTQAEKARSRRDSGDSDAVIGLGGDDSGDASA